MIIILTFLIATSCYTIIYVFFVPDDGDDLLVSLLIIIVASYDYVVSLDIFYTPIAMLSILPNTSANSGYLLIRSLLDLRNVVLVSVNCLIIVVSYFTVYLRVFI